MLDQVLKRVAVVGAAGKMGKGIAALLLQEMASLKGCHLLLVDAHEEGLYALKETLRHHLHAYAEKQINFLRQLYIKRADLISNQEMIEAFVTEGMDCVQYSSCLDEISGAHLIFEAIVENPKQKVSLLKYLHRANKDAYFLSNTSSIPISWLNSQAQLKDRIIGFHFYNPPERAKVVEYVTLENTPIELKSLAEELGKRLRKSLVPSADVAGFIGNGLLMRELLFALEKVEELNCPLPTALTLINEITQKLLLRPMGIFQLIDYVGIDVIANISNIMTEHLPGTFTHPLIEKMCNQKIFGGQHPTGEAKPGFFQYEKGVPTGVYAGKMYIPYVSEKTHFPSWKLLKKDPNQKEEIAFHFTSLASEDSMDASLALQFLKHTHETAELLVKLNIVESLDPINTVLIEGFHHLYGADNAFIP